MTKEERQILLEYLCTMVPYGIIVVDISLPPTRIRTHKLLGVDLLNGDRIDAGDYYHNSYSTLNIRPYLRSMSSMTDKEKDTYDKLVMCNKPWIAVNWLNKHYFDYLGLIKSGLALEAPEGIYNLNS